MGALGRIFPILDWGRSYTRRTAGDDLLAAVIVTIMLIPQSLAYAMLAGLPPVMGLYASILPLVLYGVMGTSTTLAVGPVAVISLMTAEAAGAVAPIGSDAYIIAAIMLAVLSGLILMVAGAFRLGFIANFLSHPVVSGFIAASGLLIALSQLKHMLGADVSGTALPDVVPQLVSALPAADEATLVIGGAALLLLLFVRSGLQPILMRMGLSPRAAGLLSRTGPVLVVAAGIGAIEFLPLDSVETVGVLRVGLPVIALPGADWAMARELLVSAALISLIGFVESVSVAQTFAAKRRERINPDQELLALGGASVAAGLSGGYPVTGGFARSAVNFDAGARTPAAGLFTAAGIAIAALTLAPLLASLPRAVLAATIIVAVFSIIDVSVFGRVWKAGRRDFSAMAATVAVTLTFGVELGVMTGVALSLLLHLYATSRPHFAVVGQVPGSEHFRNINRHDVITSDRVLTLRVDESLYFANARFLEDMVDEQVAERPGLAHVVLMCPAVNHIDASAMESLERIAGRLTQANILLHLSEVKGPVMDRLEACGFLAHLPGDVFLTQYQAMCSLDQDCAQEARAADQAAALKTSANWSRPGT